MNIVIDTSALVAVLLNEPERARILERRLDDERRDFARRIFVLVGRDRRGAFEVGQQSHLPKELRSAQVHEDLLSSGSAILRRETQAFRCAHGTRRQDEEGRRALTFDEDVDTGSDATRRERAGDRG